jgi:hypothetical protein
MVLQTQLTQRMAEAMEHHGNGGNRVAPQDEDLTRKIERFIRLKAPPSATRMTHSRPTTG